MNNRLQDKYELYPKMQEYKYTSNDTLMNEEEIENMLTAGGFLND